MALSGHGTFLRVDQTTRECSQATGFGIEQCKLQHCVCVCVACGVPFVLEHPRRSRAWEMPSTSRLWKAAGVQQHIVHMCAYGGVAAGVSEFNKRETRLVGAAPWLESVVKACPGDHAHPPALQYERARAVGSYPPTFCQALAKARLAWLANGAKTA